MQDSTEQPEAMAAPYEAIQCFGVMRMIMGTALTEAYDQNDSHVALVALH